MVKNFMTPVNALIKVGRKLLGRFDLNSSGNEI
jgi:hypothetical protein